MNAKQAISVPMLIIVCAGLGLIFNKKACLQENAFTIENSAIVADAQVQVINSGPDAIISTAEKKKIAILDLSDFISEDTQQIIRKIGVGKMASYTLTHWRNPIDSCLDALEKMGADAEHKSSVLFTYKERRMPQCIVAWQHGECEHQEVKRKLLSYLDKINEGGFFSSQKEKEMAQIIIEIALNPAHIGTISRSVPAMIKVAKELKVSGYMLYAIANLSQEAHTHIALAYPEIINLFDGVVASHQAHALKSNKKLFERLFDTYKLEPTQCLLIDKEKSTLQVAQDIGIKSIQFIQQKDLKCSLKKQGILN
ncbi:MAG: HAD hydrolase-like protein [Candidatus Dependentiae bacterium]|nr:HAD hydrolase-like protein [Candidatus Dependentiae bacterium]